MELAISMFGLTTKQRGPRTTKRLRTYFKAHQEVLVDCAHRALRFGAAEADKMLLREVLRELKLDAELEDAA
jgi:hypothetical protein